MLAGKGAPLLRPSVPVKLYLKDSVVDLAADEAATGPQVNGGRNQRDKPAVEHLSIYVDVVALVVAFQPLPHVNGPDDEDLRSDQDMPREAHSQGAEHLLGIGRQKPSTALGSGTRLSAGARVPPVHQEGPVVRPDQPCQRGTPLVPRL